MNRYAFLATALTAALYAAPAAVPVEAASTIQRCEAADGTVSYTDKNCAVFSNRAVAVSAIVVDDPQGNGGTGFAMDPMDHSRFSNIGRRSPAGGCARSPTQLQMDLRGSLALGDVNRLAESYHWVGVSSTQARGTMNRLAKLATRGVLDSQYYDASISMGGGTQLLASSSGVGGGGMLQLVLGDGGGDASIVDFYVHRYAGCYFVSF